MEKELIVWTDELLSVGIPEVDKQHKRLVDLLNSLDRAIREHHGSDVACAVLNELAEYTRVHFGTEEALMNASGYPLFEPHRLMHEDLIRQVLDLQGKVASGETRISFELLHFLKNWLTQHILGSDKKFGAYFAKSVGQHKQAVEADDARTPPAQAKRWWTFWR